jgi:tetratricopeptide (TPR) repeat protein
MLGAVCLIDVKGSGVSNLENTLTEMRALIGSGKNHEDEVLARSIYDTYESSVPLNKGLALALNFQGKLDEAYGFFEKAYIWAPDDTDLLYNLATMALNLGKLKKSEDLFLKLLGKGRTQKEVYLNYINVLIRRKDDVKALSYCEKAFQLYPDYIELGVTYIAVLESLNKLDEAGKVLSQLNASDLTSLMAARLARRRKEYKEALLLISSCHTDGFDQRTLAEYHNEFGFIEDKCAHYDEAFSHFTASNQIASRFPDEQYINSSHYRDELHVRSKLYQDRITLKPPALKSSKRSPAFFIGFPRSGTTLMEQMLKAHSQIVTTDERSPFEYLLNELKQKYSLEEIYANWQSENLEPLRIRFWQIVDGFGLECKADNLLVDKLPMNIVNVGFIRLLFPDAPLLVAYRDPRDVCLSAFMQRFKANGAMNNFLDWHQTAKTYDLVMTVWETTKENLQGDYFAYKYENLITNYEETIQQVIEYLGLSFEEGLYSYREMAKERHITTPSYREVVNPLNRDALDRWKHYPKQIDEVMPYLGKWIEKYDYESKP